MSTPVSWKMGSSIRDITPPIGTQQSGFIIRQKPSVGMHDPLFARAFALDDGSTRCCLVILDLIGVDLALVRAIRHEIVERADIPEGHIAVLATHTHGGPALLPRAHLGHVDTTYRERVAREATAVAVNAIASLQPAELRIGVGHENTVAHNRRDATGPIDPTVPIMCFYRSSELAALLVSYACHPVTLGPDNLQITRDYPGELVTTLEHLHPGAFIAFATGCCGQINTGHQAHDSLQSGATLQRTFEEAHRIGRILAAAAATAAGQAAFRSPVTGPLRVARSTLELPIAPPPDTTEAELSEWHRELVQINGQDPAREAVLRALITWGDTSGKARTAEVEVMCIGLGDACIALYPGEVFVEFGLELKTAFPDRHVVTLGFANAAPGYLPHRSAYPAGGYEVAEAYRFYGQPGPFPPEAGERLQEEMLRLVQEVLA